MGRIMIRYYPGDGVDFSVARKMGYGKVGVIVVICDLCGEKRCRRVFEVHLVDGRYVATVSRYCPVAVARTEMGLMRKMRKKAVNFLCHKVRTHAF